MPCSSYLKLKLVKISKMTEKEILKIRRLVNVTTAALRELDEIISLVPEKPRKRRNLKQESADQYAAEMATGKWKRKNH